MTRAEHLEWCKQRALEYVDAGQLQNAFASMGNDLNKHDETRDHPGIKLGLQMLIMGQLNAPESMRRYIVGFR